MIDKTYATLALGLGHCELEALAWALFHHSSLHRQIEFLLEGMGFSKFSLRQPSTVPEDIVAYMLDKVAPWYGTLLPYYYQAGEPWRCVQLREDRDKIVWLQCKPDWYSQCDLRRKDGIISRHLESYPTLFAALDALLK
jgi:hypothetical protein